MRFFTTFFALYLLLLACLPCADTNQEMARPARFVLTQTRDDSATHHADWCSPLCQCSCCAGAYLPVALTASPASPTRSYLTAVRWTALLTPACHDAFGSVWQPPQA
jgi:hypothetical protein